MRRRLTRRYVLGGICVPIGVAAAAGLVKAESYTMRLSTPTAANSAFGIMALQYAASVNRRSNDQIKVEVYPNQQLLAQNEIMESLSNGVLDFAIISTSFVEPLIPRYQVLDLPFLFRDIGTAYRILDGPIGQSLVDELSPRGISLMNWTGCGFKDLETTTKPVTVPDDMKGLRVRIQGGGIFVATYQALGAIPVTIDVAELMVAFTQHAVDAMDQYLDGFTTSKYYTVVKHVARTGHFFTSATLFGSNRKIAALPAPLQKIVKDEARAGVPAWRALFAQQLVANIAILKQNGVSFTEVQYAPFRRAVEPVYATFKAKFGTDLLDRIDRATGGR